MRMIDTHSHILPGVDDGVKTTEESLEILRTMRDTGVEGVLLTPHVAEKRGYYEEASVYEKKFQELKEHVKTAGIPIELYLGSEVDEAKGLPEILQKAPSLNGTEYVLVDFGLKEVDIEEIVYELGLFDFKVVIAHAERYTYMTIEEWEKVRDHGALIQVTAKHLIKKGRKTFNRVSRQLLKHDLVDLVASDLHTMKQAKTMKKAYRYVKRKKDQKTAEQLFYENPKKMLTP